VTLTNIAFRMYMHDHIIWCIRKNTISYFSVLVTTVVRIKYQIYPHDIRSKVYNIFASDLRQIFCNDLNEEIIIIQYISISILVVIREKRRYEIRKFFLLTYAAISFLYLYNNQDCELMNLYSFFFFDTF